MPENRGNEHHFGGMVNDFGLSVAPYRSKSP
jgi:hypothetical protein